MQTFILPINYSETSEYQSSTGLKKFCPFLRGVHYWEVILKRLSHLELNVLPAIQGMSAIWDVRYWEVALFILHCTPNYNQKAFISVFSQTIVCSLRNIVRTRDTLMLYILALIRQYGVKKRKLLKLS